MSDPIQAGTGTTNGTGGNDVILGTSGNDNIYGRDGDDIIYGFDGQDSTRGEGGNDSLFGGAGNDFLDGGFGDDLMEGGTGNDTYIVQSEGDIVTELFGEGADTVRSHLVSYTLPDNVEVLDNGSTQGVNGTGNELNNSIRGNALNNVLRGLGGNDSIGGQGGDDIIISGSGELDQLTGGAGADRFEFSASESATANATDMLRDLSFADGDTIALFGLAENGGDALLTSYAEVYAFARNTPGIQAATNANGHLFLTIPNGPFTQVINIAVPDAWTQFQAENPDPVANDDTASTQEDATVLVDVLLNDLDDTPLTLVAASAPAGQGSVSIVDNKLLFDPGTDFAYLTAGQSATVTISYEVRDALGGTDTATLTVTVNANNVAPVAGDDVATTTENASVLVDVLANDVDESPLTLASATAPAGQGTVTIENNQLRFDPGADFAYLGGGESATVVISYEVQDAAGQTDIGTLTVTVTGVNAAPVANDDAAATGENATILVDVLANDTDDGALTLVSATAPAGQGSVSIEDNKVRFNPGTSFDHLAAGQTATVLIAYEVRDAFGATDTATLTVTVTGTNDGAVIGGVDTGCVVEDKDIFACGVLSIVDVDGPDAFKPGLYCGEYGFILLGADGKWIYALNIFDKDLDQLDTGESVVDQVTIRAADGTTHTIDITVKGTTECASLPDECANANDPDNNDAFSGGQLFSTQNASQLNGNNTLRGTTGNDCIDARNGNDVVYARAGHDLVDGGAGNDTLYGGSGHDHLLGGANDDRLFGGAGRDKLEGGSGNDILIGGFGADTLFGGSGNDRFVFQGACDTNDFVCDFARGADKIDLSDFKVNGVDFNFAAPVKAHSFTAQNNLIWYHKDGKTVVLGNTDGDLNDAEFMIRLDGCIDLSASDFLL